MNNSQMVHEPPTSRLVLALAHNKRWSDCAKKCRRRYVSGGILSASRWGLRHVRCTSITFMSTVTVQPSRMSSGDRLALIKPSGLASVTTNHEKTTVCQGVEVRSPGTFRSTHYQVIVPVHIVVLLRPKLVWAMPFYLPPSRAIAAIAVKPSSLFGAHCNFVNHAAPRCREKQSPDDIIGDILHLLRRDSYRLCFLKVKRFPRARESSHGRCAADSKEPLSPQQEEEAQSLTRPSKSFARAIRPKLLSMRY